MNNRRDTLQKCIRKAFTPQMQNASFFFFRIKQALSQITREVSLINYEAVTLYRVTDIRGILLSIRTLSGFPVNFTPSGRSAPVGCGAQRKAETLYHMSTVLVSLTLFTYASYV